MAILSVTTRHLSLRPPEIGDAEALLRLMTPAISRWTATWPDQVAMVEARWRIERALAANEDGSGLNYHIHLEPTGPMIGGVGCGVKGGGVGRAELGYWIGEEFQGHGYIGEALMPFVSAVFAKLGVERIEAGTQPDNVASKAVLKRLGFQATGSRKLFVTNRQREETTDYFELARSNWEGGSAN